MEPTPEQTIEQAAAGWYVDPLEPRAFRYFDGTCWTELVSGGPSDAEPGSFDPAPSSSGGSSTRMAVFGVAAAVVFASVAVAGLALTRTDRAGEPISSRSGRSATSVAPAAESTAAPVLPAPEVSVVPAPTAQPVDATPTVPPAAAPAVPPVAAPEVAPLQLDPGGLGPLRLGMTVDQAAATGMVGPLEPGCDLGGPGELRGELGWPLAGMVRFFDGVIFEIGLDEGASTVDGVRPGMSIDEVETQAGASGFTSEIDTSFDEVFGIWLGTLTDAHGSTYAFVVDPGSGSVSSIHVPSVGFCE